VATKKRKKKLTEEWITSSEIKARLGITDNTLRKLREQNILNNGVHWMDINPYSTPRYRYHYENCKSVLVQLRKQADKLEGK
jgi:predicted DNA-binding ArsR family transcriptional regulator